MHGVYEGANLDSFAKRNSMKSQSLDPTPIYEKKELFSNKKKVVSVAAPLSVSISLSLNYQFLSISHYTLVKTLYLLNYCSAYS